MLFDRFLPKLKSKWREIPGGQGRLYSDDLGGLSEADLLAAWQGQYAGTTNREWYRRLYGRLFRGSRILDVGSGMGFDAIFFSGEGAHVTCCDVAEGNLEVIRRVARGMGRQVSTVLIDGLQSFDALGEYDVVWCNGSLLHVPFEAAREESQILLGHLRPDGRWIELAYPRERWVREGSPPFETWGTMTDGDRTPWAEWYDLEKLRRRLHPRELRPVLDLKFGYDAFIWLDVEVGPPTARPLGRAVPQPAGARWRATPGKLWNHAETVPLPKLADGPAQVEIELQVERGTLGVAVAGGLSQEAFVEARTGAQVIYLEVGAYRDGAALDVRNASALGPTRYRIDRIEVASR
jgi:SAM-dependent methyltransferase